MPSQSMCPFHQEYTLFWTAAILLLGATGVALAEVYRPRWPLRSTFLVLLGGGLFFQSLAIYLRGDLRGEFPLTNPFETLHAVVWATMVLTLVLRYSLRLTLLNVFGAGLSAALGVIALAMPHWDADVVRTSTASSPWTAFHAWAAVLGYGLFAVLTATSLMYLLQHYSLKRGWLGGLFARLPSVRLLELLNRRILLAGVLALSLALGMGLLNWVAQPATVGAAKLATAGALWVVYVTLYALRASGRLRASQFAGGCAAAFFGAVFALWPLTSGNGQAAPPDPAPSPSAVAPAS